MTTEIDFSSIDAALRRAEAGVEAAECHGALCGLICAQPANSSAIWLNDVLAPCDPENRYVPEIRRQLQSLSEITIKDLSDPEFGFQPLLPPDDHPLQARTLAISQWCQGFLQGLRRGGVAHPEELAGDAGEIVRDLAAIGKAGRFEVSDSDENEADFAELVEYLRAGVRLVYEELRDVTAAPDQRRGVTH